MTAPMDVHDRNPPSAALQEQEAGFDSSSLHSISYESLRPRRSGLVDAVDNTSTCASSDEGDDEGDDKGVCRDDGTTLQGDSDDEERRLNCKLDSPRLPFVPSKDLLAALGRVLQHLAEIGNKPQPRTCFHAAQLPEISIADYLARLVRWFKCSDGCLVMSLVYIDRVVKTCPEVVVSPWSVHRLLVTSLVLAAKFWDDDFYSNRHYAGVGGVKLQELNSLEARFLGLIGWRLTVSPEEYDMYESYVIAAVKSACRPKLTEKRVASARTTALQTGAASSQRPPGDPKVINAEAIVTIANDGVASSTGAGRETLTAHGSSPSKSSSEDVEDEHAMRVDSNGGATEASAQIPRGQDGPCRGINESAPQDDAALGRRRRARRKKPAPRRNECTSSAAVSSTPPVLEGGAA